MHIQLRGVLLALLIGFIGTVLQAQETWQVRPSGVTKVRRARGDFRFPMPTRSGDVRRRSMWRDTLARVSGVLLFMSCLAQPAGEWARMKPMVPRGYLCVRAASPVTVDGRLDDAAWKQAPWTADFVDIEGAVKPVPRYRTRAKMLWDDKYFYIAAELQEPHVWATITQRDAVIFQDPDFEVFIDPDGDSAPVRVADNEEVGELV